MEGFRIWESARSVLEFLVSAAGLSVIAVFITQFAKNKLKWEAVYAQLLAVGVAAVVGVLAFFGLKYEVYVYINEYWPLIVALVVVVGTVFGGSQLLYRNLPTTNGDSEQ